MCSRREGKDKCCNFYWLSCVREPRNTLQYWYFSYFTSKDSISDSSTCKQTIVSLSPAMFSPLIYLCCEAPLTPKSRWKISKFVLILFYLYTVFTVHGDLWAIEHAHYWGTRFSFKNRNIGVSIHFIFGIAKTLL